MLGLTYMDEYYQQVQAHSPKHFDAMSDAGQDGRRFQSAARAAKRQRGRERRKFFKAAAQASKLLEEQADREKMTVGFEERAAAVAAECKLVVKKTFFEVNADDSSSSSDFESEIHLPSAFFKSTREIDEWRRCYRRFRLGHHQGAKGELTVASLSSCSISALDLKSCAKTRWGYADVIST